MSNLTLDRPDVIKEESKPELTFKEVKDSLFKFLMLADIPFVDAERLTLASEYKSKSTEDTFLIRSGLYYTTTCKLKDLTVDGQSVHIIIIPDSYESLEYRQRNKIMALKKQHHIVIFDIADYKAIGLDISGKEWLKPLTKSMLKLWAKKLFEKISKLGKNVKSKYTLNDVYKNIEANTAAQENKISRINSLEKENLALKQQLRSLLIKEHFSIKESNAVILESLSSINKMATLWIESIVNLILIDILEQVDLRQNKYKDLFRLKNGKIQTSNKDMLCEFLQSELSRRRPNLSVSYLGHGILLIKDSKTFEKLVLNITTTTANINPVVTLSKDLVSKLPSGLIYNLVLQFSNTQSKISRMIGDIILVSNYGELFKYDLNHRLQVYDSKVNKKYSLWTIEV